MYLCSVSKNGEITTGEGLHVIKNGSVKANAETDQEILFFFVLSLIRKVAQPSKQCIEYI